ncbi:cupin domain-containing protein [Actinotalea sp. K2]|uniref:cupin domain-containing protein n=1 Tax=Actinotalea sp. K2 TaxID=2939438 RepID=UPI002017FA3A|nr:cupin domain-containing protein [Actinotalea sp. K2]MCL3861198.1 cupin domain-containing protein [Actinotalea sp. K2]
MSLVGEVIAGNDRSAAAHDQGATQYPDLLAEPLGPVRLEGAVFLRAEYHEGWAYSSMPGRATASLLHPGSQRVLLFHLVASGACWVALSDGERHWAGAGDVIVLPYGDEHTMGGIQDAEVVPIASFIPPTPWTEMPVLRRGVGEGEHRLRARAHRADPRPARRQALRAAPDRGAAPAPGVRPGCPDRLGDGTA